MGCPECGTRRFPLWVSAGCIGALDDASGGGRKVPGKGRGGDQRDGYRLSGRKPDDLAVVGCCKAGRLAGRLAWRPALRPRRAAAGGMRRAGGAARPTARAAARPRRVAAGNYPAGKQASEHSQGALIHVRQTRQLAPLVPAPALRQVEPLVQHPALTSVIAGHARCTARPLPRIRPKPG